MIANTTNLSKREMVSLKKAGKLNFGGHKKSKIYGTLDCPGAQRWIARGHYVKNRVFFSSEEEAIREGYRPCANCMPAKYKVWKNNQ